MLLTSRKAPSLALAATLLAATGLPAMAQQHRGHGGGHNFGGSHGGHNLNPGLPQAPQIGHSHNGWGGGSWGGGYRHYGGGGNGLAVLGAILGGVAVASPYYYAPEYYSVPQYAPAPQCGYWGPWYQYGYQWVHQWYQTPCR